MMTPLLLTPCGHAQQGDRTGETQQPLPESLVIPESPPLSPQDSLSRFAVPQGLKIELVASEPLVQAPVMSRFGPDGRLWVVEMPGYMTDLDGSAELEPSGRIVVLEDTDRDGQMDTRTVFMDNLVLPRAVAPLNDGALIISPPDLLLARDHDNDGRADQVTVVDSTFGGLDSPEHAGNGLLFGMDNWFHCSQHPWEYRLTKDGVERRLVQPHGQWGLAADKWNNLFFTPNSYPLMSDVVPRHVLAMNPSQRDTAGTYMRVPADESVHSIRINPGVNRGYRPETLDDDFKLNSFTAACGPMIYLDTVIGAEFEGDAFICEPAGNTVEHRDMIDVPDEDPPWKAEATLGAIIASEDERFRPVNLQTGPDGAIYITDMYRGILQHKIFMTSFLRRQIIERQLQTPVDRGRIWRLVPKQDELGSIPDLSMLDDHHLVDQLEHANGTIRLLAQQSLVERTDLPPEILHKLESMSLESDLPVARAHAIWTLDGRHSLDPELLARILRQGDSALLMQALDISANHLEAPDIRMRVLEKLTDDRRAVRRRAAAAIAYASADEIIPELSQALEQAPGDRIMRSLIIAGARGHELLLLRELSWLDSWRYETTERADMTRSIIRTALRHSDPEQNLMLLEWIAAIPSDQNWLAEIAASEVVSHYRMRSADPRGIDLSTSPFDWHARIEEEGDLAGGLLRLIDAHAKWPGRPGYEPLRDDRDWSTDERRILNRGAALYANCAGCHQQSGLGIRGFYPPLADSPLVIGSPEPLLAILLKGLEGPVTIQGVTYDQPMPPAPFQTDEELAAIASFIRSSFDNDGSFVTKEDVQNARKKVEYHSGPMTVPIIDAIWPE